MTLDDIERCFVMLKAHLRTKGVDRLQLGSADIYWTICSPDWLNMSVEPTAGVGSLRDDEEMLKRMLDEPSRVNAVDLERFAHILLFLSDQLAK
jgi:hypothetical protein